MQDTDSCRVTPVPRKAYLPRLRAGPRATTQRAMHYVTIYRRETIIKGSSSFIWLSSASVLPRHAISPKGRSHVGKFGSKPSGIWRKRLWRNSAEFARWLVRHLWGNARCRWPHAAMAVKSSSQRISSYGSVNSSACLCVALSACHSRSHLLRDYW